MHYNMNIPLWTDSEWTIIRIKVNQIDVTTCIIRLLLYMAQITYFILDDSH